MVAVGFIGIVLSLTLVHASTPVGFCMLDRDGARLEARPAADSHAAGRLATSFSTPLARCVTESPSDTIEVLLGMQLAGLDAVGYITARRPRGLLIWLHGVGDTGEGRHRIGAQLVPDELAPEWNTVLLTAPFNLDAADRAWFAPSAHLVPEGATGWNSKTAMGEREVQLREDAAGLLKSAKQIAEAVREAARRFFVPLQRVVLGGFSQGGAASLYVCTVLQLPVGGCVGAASWLPLTTQLPSIGYNSPAVLLLHGSQDEIVEVARAKYAARVLIRMRVPVSLVVHEALGHNSNSELVEQVRLYVKRVTGGTTPFEGSQQLTSAWRGVSGLPINNCHLRPRAHWICQNTRERRTYVPLERHECLKRCEDSRCHAVQYQHDVTGNTTNNWCHLYMQPCKPGVYASEQSGAWCMEILANARF